MKKKEKEMEESRAADGVKLTADAAAKLMKIFAAENFFVFQMDVSPGLFREKEGYALSTFRFELRKRLFPKTGDQG